LKKYALGDIIGIPAINPFVFAGYLLHLVIQYKYVKDIINLSLIEAYSEWIGYATYLNASTL
jgi:hypothetical protein